ncbi:recombinase family protein [Crossiella sp. S99.1]|uniref:recombinase family protein n=1 Tax=Crossiella sp. S99.1 TaxID=2936271 RepID=UPI001FFE7345|nr:recombinase family protein [Crossiella sp. S99.1]MCK2258303.1 recombinase family protein [Crossiella sp. S99.1]
MIDSYGRLSRVPDTGELEKIATQLADNKNRIKHVGGQLGEEFSDGMSAWKAGVRRPDWEKMLERARLGLSHGICIWHTDRLFRKPRDLETLIELADKGFLIVSSHGVRDLSNPDDRFILRIEVAQAAKSSDDTARRVKRRFQSRREEGKSHDNARVFGFPGRQRRRKGETKAAIDAGIDLPALPEVTAEQVRAERAAIAKGAKDFLAGMTQSDIAAEWNAQGLRTTSGLTVTSMDIRQILAHARYAGLIEHQGEIVGEIADADPIFDEQTFYRIRAKIASRRRGALAGVKSVASGIMRCGQCGNPMYSRFGTRNAAGVKSRAYQCRRDRFAGCGRVAGTMAGIDAEIRRLVIQRLSDARFTAALTAARAAVADRLSEVNKEIAECEEVQTSLSVRLGRREIKQPAFDAANMPLVADLTALYAEREALLSGTPAEPVGLLHADDVARAWDAATIPQRSAMLRQAVGTDRLVLRRSVRKGGRGFDPSRVRLEPAPAPAPVTVPGSVAA